MIGVLRLVMTCALLTSCAHGVAPDIVPLEVKAYEAQRTNAHLQLVVSPRVCFLPCRVTLTAHIVGEAGIERFYCAPTAWHFGDTEAEPSTSVPDCDPQNPEIERSWSREYVYRRQPGEFLIHFTAAGQMVSQTVRVLWAPGSTP